MVTKRGIKQFNQFPYSPIGSAATLYDRSYRGQSAVCSQVSVAVYSIVLKCITDRAVRVKLVDRRDSRSRASERSSALRRRDASRHLYRRRRRRRRVGVRSPPPRERSASAGARAAEAERASYGSSACHSRSGAPAAVRRLACESRADRHRNLVLSSLPYYPRDPGKMGTFCYNFSKYTLAAMSLVFLIISVTVITLVACMLSDKTYLVSIAEEGNNYEAGLYILLCTGILMLIVSILGWCSAFKHSRYCLATFFSIMLVIVVAQVAFAGWLYAHKDRLDELVRSSVINTVKDEYGEIQCRTQIMDTIQATLECCGANGPEDWAGSKYASQDSSQSRFTLGVSNANNVFKIPKSCCKDVTSTACNEGRKMKLAGIVSSAIYSEGCMEKLVTTLKTQTYHFMGAAILVLVLEILSLILALICCCKGGPSDRYKA